MKNSLGEAQGKMDLAQRRNGATKNGSRATTQIRILLRVLRVLRAK